MVRNIGEALAYAGGEQLKWHHDGNQIHRWLEQLDVLSSLIVRYDDPSGANSSPTSWQDEDGSRHLKDLPPTLAVKPHDGKDPRSATNSASLELTHPAPPALKALMLGLGCRFLTDSADLGSFLAMWPQVRLHPPVGSKLDLVGTGAIAEHARKTVSKRTVGGLVSAHLPSLPPRVFTCHDLSRPFASGGLCRPKDGGREPG